MDMSTPIPRRNDPDMQAVPAALLRAAENARRLAEQTGTPFIVRQPPVAGLNGDGKGRAPESERKA